MTDPWEKENITQRFLPRSSFQNAAEAGGPQTEPDNLTDMRTKGRLSLTESL